MIDKNGKFSTCPQDTHLIKSYSIVQSETRDSNLLLKDECLYELLRVGKVKNSLVYSVLKGDFNNFIIISINVTYN